LLPQQESEKHFVDSEAASVKFSSGIPVFGRRYQFAYVRIYFFWWFMYLVIWKGDFRVSRLFWFSFFLLAKWHYKIRLCQSPSTYVTYKLICTKELHVIFYICSRALL
jgi:hypothetical protein